MGALPTGAGGWRETDRPSVAPAAVGCREPLWSRRRHATTVNITKWHGWSSTSPRRGDSVLVPPVDGTDREQQPGADPGPVAHRGVLREHDQRVGPRHQLGLAVR